MGRVLFTGFYGFQNTGDDAFCNIADWGARKYWKSQQVGLLSNQQLLNLEARPILNFGRIRGIYQLESILKTSFRWHNIVFAGGSLFHSQMDIYRKFLNSYSSKLDLKLGAIGISIGPFKNKEALNINKDLLGKFSFISVRDQRSYELGCEMGLEDILINSFDLAALMPTVFPLGSQSTTSSQGFSKKKTIGVSLCHYESFINGDLLNEKRRENKLRELLLHYAKNDNFRFRFFIFNGNPQIGDKPLTDKIYNNVRELNPDCEIIDYSANVESTWNAIAECDLVLSVRLHASIFAYFANRPFLLVEYHKKCSDFLDEIGFPKSLRLEDMQFSLKENIEKVDQLLNDCNPPLLNREDLTTKAMLSFNHEKVIRNYV